MALKLPRLQREVAIVSDDGSPMQAFQLWWQRTAEAIEGAVNDIVAILVRLGLVEVTADGALELAESAINPGGTIKDDKVLTQSIVAEGATAGYYTQLAAPIAMPNGVDTEIVSISFTKTLSSYAVDPVEGSSITIDATLRMESSDDIVGYFRIWRGGGPGVGTMIDEMFRRTQYNGNCRVGVVHKFIDEDAPAGPTTYVASFERDGGGSSVNAVAGSIVDVLERKR